MGVRDGTLAQELLTKFSRFVTFIKTVYFWIVIQFLR